MFRRGVTQRPKREHSAANTQGITHTHTHTHNTHTHTHTHTHSYRCGGYIATGIGTLPTIVTISEEGNANFPPANSDTPFVNLQKSKGLRERERVRERERERERERVS